MYNIRTFKEFCKDQGVTLTAKQEFFVESIIEAMGRHEMLEAGTGKRFIFGLLANFDRVNDQYE